MKQKLERRKMTEERKVEVDMNVEVEVEVDVEANPEPAEDPSDPHTGPLDDDEDGRFLRENDPRRIAAESRRGRRFRED
jgi:hypothetical protein